MLSAAVDRYLELRRTLGHKLEGAEAKLRSFSRYAQARGDTHVFAATALDWAAQTATARQRTRRLRVVTRFANFLHAEDHRHEIPPPVLICPTPPRPLPHIFTAEEVHQLFDAASQLWPRRSLRPMTYSTLFNLLSVTGLRVSEALALRIDDFTRGGLIVRQTKFRKSRLVPLHETTAAALTRYLVHRQRLLTPTDHIFVSLRKTPLCYEQVRRTFRELCAKSGLTNRPRPRLHDYRHTVAVRMLKNARRTVIR